MPPIARLPALTLRAVAVALALVAGAPAATPAADPARVAVLAALHAADLRVATVAYRLATHATPFCRRTARWPGLLVADLSAYDAAYRPAAAAVLHLDAGPAIAGVVADGPAARAGIVAGDVLLAIGDRPVADILGALPPKGASDAPTERLLDAIDAASAPGPLRLSLLRAGRRFAVRIDGVAGCASRVQLVPGRRLNAGADGAVVTLSTALLENARSDDELAFILAHELAHNILGHRVRLEGEGVSHGLLAGIGENAAKIRRIEEEADYLGIYMVTRAGYDPAAAAAFWQRFDRAHGAGIFADATHLNGARRIRFLTLAAEEASAQRRAGQPLEPDLEAGLARLLDR